MLMKNGASRSKRNASGEAGTSCSSGILQTLVQLHADIEKHARKESYIV